MEPPQIQYVQTKDGVNIAFSTQGDGPAIVRMANLPWSHFQLQWEKMPGRRAVVRSMAERFTYVQYDFRGAGSSTREVADFSLDAHILDLEAVVDHLELENFTLIAILNSGPLAIAYGARNPQRISRLILVNSYARYSDVLATPEGQVFQALRGKDWTIYTETASQIVTGWSGEAARVEALLLRESASREMALAAYLEIEKFDVTDILPQIQTPTLIAHGNYAWPPVELSRSLAAQIPGARLAVANDRQGTQIAIDEFLADREGTKPKAEQAIDERPVPGGFATILFTDMEGSTTLADRLGDAAAQEVRRAHDNIVRSALESNAGSEIKHTGDGGIRSRRCHSHPARRCRTQGGAS